MALYKKEKNERILIFTCLIYNLFSAVDSSLHLLQQNIPNILGSSQTIEELNANIAKFELSGDKKLKQIVDDKALQIISSYLQHKFPGEFNSSDFFADALNKGDLYHKYLEPLIFITKNLNLSDLNKLLIASGIDTNIDMKKSYDKYDIINLLKEIRMTFTDTRIKLEDKLNLLLKIGFANNKNNNGKTAIIWASENGLKSVVEILIKAGANVNEKNKYGETALIEASKKGYIDIVSLLIDAGADIDLADNDEETALIAAAYNRKNKVVDLLLKSGANVDMGSDSQRTALSCAAATSNLKLVDLLLKSNANANLKNSEGNTPLMSAINPRLANYLIWEEYLEIIKLLIPKSDINSQNNEGNTALMIAIENKIRDVVSLLLDSNANTDIQNINGDTALIIAVKYGLKKIVRLLLEKGANVDIKNKNGQTAYSLAKDMGFIEIPKLLKKKYTR